MGTFKIQAKTLLNSKTPEKTQGFKVLNKTHLESSGTSKDAILRIQSKTQLESSPQVFLQGLRVKDRLGKVIQVSEMWNKKTVILKVLRRFGCPLCRYESRLLSELKPDFDDLDVRLIAIGCENIGFDEFLYGGYWNWEIYVDEERSVYTALGLNSATVGEVIKDSVSLATRIALAAAQAIGIQGNVVGNSQQLGGTFIIHKGNGKILYEMKQTSGSDFCSLKELFEVCGGDPEVIDEKAPEECTVYRKKYLTGG